MDPVSRRLAALAVLGLVAFVSPVFGAFNRPVWLAGFPLLPLYLFGCWATLVAAAALLERRR